MPFVLIDDAQSKGGAQLYADPREILTCTAPEQAPDVIAKIERALSDGHHVAGYLAYELGYLLEPKLTPLLADRHEGPLIWMGVFDAPVAVDDGLFDTWAKDDFEVGALETPISRDNYIAQVERIREHIRAGDVYQINHTFKQRFDFAGSAQALYAHLRQRQRAAYGAVVYTGEEHILSLSPELFFESQSGVARTRPMKGTAPRAANPADDDALKHWLCHDEKSKAENLMIVDLLRNDLGRVSLVGSVNVTDLFTVETYPTLHQMTSGIESKLRPGTGFGDLLHALFPCGSVTGAPKVKAMEIIHELESEPRGVYTGAVGAMEPSGSARFNVAIRTLKITNNRGELGIGSGIVHDSDPAAEWAECHLKANFLTAPHQPFELLETLLWQPDTGFALLERHMARLANSAAYFCYPCDTDAVIVALNEAVEGTTTPQRVRLLLDHNGRASVEAVELAPLNDSGELRFAVSNQRIDRGNPFVYHKTTNRAFYDDERDHQKERTGCDEVVFLNDAGELTEGSITNLFIERAGQLTTPPVACGLLDGTLRRDLIDSGRASEAPLTPADLEGADRIYLGNSVRGLMPAKPV